MNKESNKPNVQGIFAMPIYTSDGYFLDEDVKEKIIQQTSDENLKNWNGNVTSNNRNILDQDYLSDLKKHLQTHVERFGYEVFKITHGVKFHITQSWCNLNDKGTGHHIHRHANSFFSGTYYIRGETPITFQKNVEAFQNFEFDINGTNQFNSDQCQFKIKEGRIILFPSVLSHFVDNNETDEQRVSLSFNCFFDGSLKTNIDNATYLKIGKETNLEIGSLVIK